MAINPPAIVIAGCGPGSPDYLTDAVRRAVAEAEVLVGSRRLLELFPQIACRRIPVDSHIEAVLDSIAELRSEGRQVVVLVSGDPCLYSLGQRLVAHFGRENCRIIPGVSSVQAAFARLGLDWSDARILSAHGRTPGISPADLARHDKLAVLTGGRAGLEWSSQVVRSLRESHEAWLCENLTLPGERVRPVAPEDLKAADIAALAIVVLVRRPSR
jgi:cobalt-precorrin-7 (C5)-methyltransferase